jgi:ribosomal protein S18 acetylase RimI-like enzyme
MRESETSHHLSLVQENRGREQESEEKLQEAVLRTLEKYGVIENLSGKRVFDIAKLKDWSSRNEINVLGRKLNRQEIIVALSGVRGFVKSEMPEASDDASVERPVFVTPRSLEDLLSQTQEGYGQRSHEALLQPWEFGQKQQEWVKPLVLDKGEQTNLAEMAMVSILKKWQAQRGEDGILTVVHPVTGERVTFSPSLLKKFADINPQAGDKNKHINWNSNGIIFADGFMTHLLESGILKKDDFRTLAGSKSAEIYGTHERRFADRPTISWHAMFANKNGQSVKYYLGKRKDGKGGKLVGTETTINPETMRIRQLDPKTVGITETNDGKTVLLYTFPLLDKDNLSEMQQSTETRLKARGRPAEPKHISANTVVGGKTMKNLMKEYSITDYLLSRPGENPKEYYKRLRPLDDPEFVSRKVHDFFSQAGIGTHNLPWAEQLVLSRALLEETDEAMLLEFAKKFGLAGIRSFLSLDYDRNLGKDILDLGESLDVNLSREIFKKYGEIVDTAKQAENYAYGHLQGEAGNLQLSAAKIREQMLRKAKDLFVEFSRTTVKGGGQLEAVRVMQRLESVKAGVLLFAAACKNLPAEAKLDFHDIANTAVENLDSGELTTEEKSDMEQIFRANRTGNYPQRLFEETVRDFRQTINEPGHNFRMLKHEGSIVAFFHYDELDDGRVYVGSLNLHPSAKDSPIAVAMVKSALEEMAGKDLEAVVWAQNPARLFYTRMLGFKKTGEIADYHGTGETYWSLNRPKQNKAQHQDNVVELKQAA